jgi:hypothetical protein
MKNIFFDLYKEVYIKNGPNCQISRKKIPNCMIFMIKSSK